MIAILTDKPNVGREIARVVGAHKKENGYMTGGGYMVTWTFGNMLSLAMPKDSGKARVEWEDFPLVPPPYLTVKNMKTDTGWNPDINAVLQLKVIAKVFDACDTIIAATDASREGEMLFRHLYRFLGCKQPCLRLWISSLTDEAILEGMANLRPCHQFDNLFLAADSRNRADWMLGVNSSYAVCKAVGFGNNSLGRVQTPVLAAISGRYRERENHIGADSWPVFISICKDNRIIKMRRTEDFEEHRNATELYEDCKAARKARITAVSRRTEEVRAPALYDLTGLQTDANLYHGLTAIQVQEITQSLYEKKLISYPRTACRFLPEDVYATLPAVMEKMLARKEFRTYADRLDIAGAKAVINPLKTTEHHAIIITGMSPGDLTREEMQVYTLIVGRMLEAFSPSCKVEYTTVDAVCAAHKFRTRTYRILEKDGPASWDGNISSRKKAFQPLPSRAVPGRTGRGGRLQHHPQEKPAALPLYGCGTGRIHGQERTGNGSHTSQHHPHLARTQIYPLFGEICHSDSQGALFLRNGTGHENSRRLPHLGLGSGTGADRAGRTDTGGISGRCTGTGEGDYR